MYPNAGQRTRRWRRGVFRTSRKKGRGEDSNDNQSPHFIYPPQNWYDRSRLRAFSTFVSCQMNSLCCPHHKAKTRPFGHYRSCFMHFLKERHCRGSQNRLSFKECCKSIQNERLHVLLSVELSIRSSHLGMSGTGFHSYCRKSPILAEHTYGRCAESGVRTFVRALHIIQVLPFL